MKLVKTFKRMHLKKPKVNRQAIKRRKERIEYRKKARWFGGKEQYEKFLKGELPWQQNYLGDLKITVD